jgi:hypothetical protein
MAHLTGEIAAMANHLCAVLPVAENGDRGDDLGRAGTALYTRIITTVVLGEKP